MRNVFKALLWAVMTPLIAINLLVVVVVMAYHAAQEGMVEFIDWMHEENE